MSMKSVDAATLKTWLDHHEAVLVDVREPAEHAAAHIKQATLLPLSQVATDRLPETKGKTLVIHCLKGGRGQTACQTLLAQNPELEIYNLEGGITAWSAAGLPTHSTTQTPILPLDRQTQLTIGLGILTMSVLAAVVHPGFIWGAAFFGAGLTVAGITGFCGLARVLAVMPWNQKA